MGVCATSSRPSWPIMRPVVLSAVLHGVLPKPATSCAAVRRACWPPKPRTRCTPPRFSTAPTESAPPYLAQGLSTPCSRCESPISPSDGRPATAAWVSGLSSARAVFAAFAARRPAAPSLRPAPGMRYGSAPPTADAAAVPGLSSTSWSELISDGLRASTSRAKRVRVLFRLPETSPTISPTPPTIPARPRLRPDLKPSGFCLGMPSSYSAVSASMPSPLA